MIRQPMGRVHARGESAPMDDRPLLDVPFRVTVFLVRRPEFRAVALEAGDAREAITEIKTYWVREIATVHRHMATLREEYELAGWDVSHGPIGIGWGYRRSAEGSKLP